MTTLDTGPTRPGPVFRALLVGVDFYELNRTSAGAFASLSGCVRDVESVAAMLHERVALPRSITKLLSPAAEGKQAPPEPGAALPTYENLRAALERLVEETREGDFVLIYYSGHGARVATRFEDLKRPGRFDEALVPMDIRNKEARYVRDVDLAFILHCLVKKKAVITLVIDSCHSAGVTRGGPGTSTAVRCATGGPSQGAVDTTELSPEGFASDDELRAAYNALRATGRVTRDASTGKTWLPPSKGYVLLAASLETQAALEASIDGRPRMGVLTWAWLDTLRDIGAEQSWKTVFERTARRMGDAGFRHQTPVLLGDEHREVLGTRLRETAHTLSVAEVDREGARLRVDGGLAMGLNAGTELGVYAPGTADFTSDAGLVAVARVTEASAGAAWAACDAAHLSQVVVDAPVFVRGLSTRCTIALVPGDAPPPGLTRAQERDALDAVHAALSQRGEGFVTEAPPGATPTFQVGVNGRARYCLMSAEGAPLARTSAIPIHANNAALQVVDWLTHLARYSAVARISSPPSSLDADVEVTFVAHDTDAALMPGERGRYGLPPGAFDVRIKNGSPFNLFLGILALQSDFEIKVLWPPDDKSKAFEEVAPRSNTSWPIEFSVPDGFTSVEDRLKVFLLTTPADFRRLTLPLPGSRSAPGGLGAPASPLDRIFESTARVTRGAKASRAAPADAPWRVQDLLLEIKPPPRKARGLLR